jgi:hypothetical protein
MSHIFVLLVSQKFDANQIGLLLKVRFHYRIFQTNLLTNSARNVASQTAGVTNF